jgi:uncharacterized protein YjiS (DUF1127 family)
MTDTVLNGRDASSLPRHITPKATRRRVSVVLCGLARAYWDYRLRCATIVALQKLDDRTLADLGIDRHEIESVVNDRTRDRACRYSRR